MRNTFKYLTFITPLPHYSSFTTLLLLADFVRGGCWTTAHAVQLSSLQLHWAQLEVSRTGWKLRCVIQVTEERVKENLQAKTEGKVVKRTEQTERNERAVEEGSLDKERQIYRISLSHSRGRWNKLRLQRNETESGDRLEKKGVEAANSSDIAKVLIQKAFSNHRQMPGGYCSFILLTYCLCKAALLFIITIHHEGL